MATAMDKYAVIVAGGSGLRMGSAVPKQFLELRGKPLLWYTLNTFLQSFDDLQIILVLPSSYLSQGEMLRKLFLEKSDRIVVTAGGETRFHSVQNGLQLVSEPSIVFVHDGVRCLVSRELVRSCYEQAVEKGSAIPAVMATDSIRIVSGSGHVVADRNQIRIIQTPQTFQSAILLPAFTQLYEDAFTDEATVVENAGTAVQLIAGEYENIKVTRPTDLLVAEKILAERSALE
jgi:2-C-methyl-D-erythritol 4-phosphate cytidylyltransferase